MREDRLGTAQADLRRARDTGRTSGVEVDVVGGITGLILGVLVTNVFVATQGRAVVLTWASVLRELVQKKCCDWSRSGTAAAAPARRCDTSPADRLWSEGEAASAGTRPATAATRQ